MVTIRRWSSRTTCLVVVVCTVALFEMRCAQSDEPALDANRVDAKQAHQFQTIAHEILDLEAATGEVTPRHYEILDQLIAAAKQEFGEIAAQDLTQRSTALQALNRMGNLLARLGFRHQAGVKSLSEAFSLRTDRYRRNYYTYDCDTGSFLYLAIAEELDLPISIVEVKFDRSRSNHNFVRWNLGGEKFVDWDTNGRYERRPVKANGFYGTPFPRQRVAAYAYYLRAKTWEEAGDIEKATADYQLALKLDPEHPHAANNLAWLFASNRHVQEFCPGEQALAAAQVAVKVDRDANHLDTLACVQAELGNFDAAVEAETEAMRLHAGSEYFNRRFWFKRKKTYLEQTGR